MKIEHNHEQDDLNNKTITPYFDVRRRNFGHWDIWDAHGRIFAIRGGPGRYYVRDSRSEEKRKETFYAKTVGMCMGYICEELMFEVLVAGGQEIRTIEPWNI